MEQINALRAAVKRTLWFSGLMMAAPLPLEAIDYPWPWWAKASAVFGSLVATVCLGVLFATRQRSA